MAVIASQQPRLLQDLPCFQACTSGHYLAALRSLPDSTSLIVIFLDRQLLRCVNTRATRAVALMRGIPLLIICTEESINWPDDVESRISIGSDEEVVEISLFNKLFNNG